MAIQGVDTKCYILALFVRDDGERFLLGSGHYEFKDSQMHFAANAIQNDIVEVQGNDGFLLAGQVRRPGTQSFDGYVGDGTMSKEETESYRRQFFSFFRKNFFYKVIYVFSDGTAIQRKSGFLVDDPTVEELYQMYPEYHVALNFEDVNYYSYSENEQGEEQYAKEAQIDLSSMVATGGLIWDEYGALNQGYAWGGETTASGTEFTVQNDLSLPAPITDTKLYGDSEQQTYTGKNLLYTPDGTFLSNQVTWTASNNTVVASGTAGSSSYSALTAFLDKTIPAGTYTFSIKDPVTKRVQFACRKDSSSPQVTNLIPIGSTSVTFTLEEDMGQYHVVCLDAANADFTGFTISAMQLEAGSGATSFEPYVGGIPAPNPQYPQDMHTVTGVQTITIANGDNTQVYVVDLGTTELCKIGDYQDYIYKSGDDWYVHKEIVKISPNGTETWLTTGTQPSGQFYVYTTAFDTIVKTRVYTGLVSNNFIMWRGEPSWLTPTTVTNGAVFSNSDASDIAALRIMFPTSLASSVEAVKTWLASNLPVFYYPIATPTDTKITDATLVSQLDALGSAKLMVGENNVLVSATDANLPAELQIKYYSTVSFEGAGFVWEEGGSGGATVVEVDSITNTYPIWRVKGPAVDPQLSVINTNTTIRYTGTVTSTQTLEIDMFNKTAKLNGVSVIGNVSGDWVSLAPGTNRVIYTAENADAQPSTIEWQEVVG